MSTYCNQSAYVADDISLFSDDGSVSLYLEEDSIEDLDPVSDSTHPSTVGLHGTNTSQVDVHQDEDSLEVLFAAMEESPSVAMARCPSNKGTPPSARPVDKTPKSGRKRNIRRVDHDEIEDEDDIDNTSHLFTSTGYLKDDTIVSDGDISEEDDILSDFDDDDDDNDDDNGGRSDGGNQKDDDLIVIDDDAEDGIVVKPVSERELDHLIQSSQMSCIPKSCRSVGKYSLRGERKAIVPKVVFAIKSVKTMIAQERAKAARRK